MSQLTKESPFIKRYMAWVNERFPFANALVIFVLYGTALLIGQSSTRSGALSIGVPEWIGFFSAWGFFLMLRVFDEHKDYEQDCKNYPDRILQSGLITLTHLKITGAIAIGAQLAGSLILDGGVGASTLWWIAVVAYASLMAKEFFVGEWLEKRLVLYALSHMIVMPLALIWWAQMGAAGAPISVEIWILAGLAFLSGAALEVTRKTRGPEEERDTVDSYSKSLGLKGAVVTVILMMAGSTALNITLLQRIFDGAATPAWMGGLVGGGLILPMATLIPFLKNPSAKGRKANEGSVGVAMLLSYAILIAAMVVERGVG